MSNYMKHLRSTSYSLDKLSKTDKWTITQGGAGVVFFLIRKSSFDRIATCRIDISVKELLNRLVKDPQKCLTERIWLSLFEDPPNILHFVKTHRHD